MSFFILNNIKLFFHNHVNRLFLTSVFNRGGNAGRPVPFRPTPHKARTPRASPSRPAHFMWATYSNPPHIYVGPLFLKKKI